MLVYEAEYCVLRQLMLMLTRHTTGDNVKDAFHHLQSISWTCLASAMIYVSLPISLESVSNCFLLRARLAALNYISYCLSMIRHVLFN